MTKLNYKKASEQILINKQEKSLHLPKPKFGYAERTVSKPPVKEYKEKCPLCGCKLYIRNGKFGEFVGCINYPKCKYTKQLSKMPQKQSKQPVFFKVNPKKQEHIRSYCLRKNITVEEQMEKMINYIVQDEKNWQAGKENNDPCAYNIHALCPKCKKKMDKQKVKKEKQEAFQ